MRQFIYFFAFQLNVYCDNQLIVGCPISFKVLADRSKVTFSSIDHCAVGMITELKVSLKSLLTSSLTFSRFVLKSIHVLSSKYVSLNIYRKVCWIEKLVRDYLICFLRRSISIFSIRVFDLVFWIPSVQNV